jgi:hypothetical protein
MSLASHPVPSLLVRPRLAFRVVPDLQPCSEPVPDGPVSKLVSNGAASLPALVDQRARPGWSVTASEVRRAV